MSIISLRRFLESLEENQGREERKEVKELLRLVQDLAAREESGLRPQELAAILRERYERLMEECEFRPGQLVKWKEGLKNKKRPRYGEPAIVVEVLEEPVFDEKEGGGSPYFREPLDIVLGVILEGDFVLFHYDKRRFEPFEASMSENK